MKKETKKWKQAVTQNRNSERLRYQLPVILCVLLAIVLVLIPTGYEGAQNYQGADRSRARVLSVDNSTIIDTGLIRTGEQSCELELLDGNFKGEIVTGVNLLKGSLESDKLYSEGDIAYVVVEYEGEEIRYILMVDHYRISWEFLLIGLFVLLLVLFGGRTGLRAVYSFIITILMIWKVLVPGYLNGADPIVLGILITIALTILIISLVYGFDRRLLSASSGAVLGVLVTVVVGAVFTNLLKIHGAVMSYSESLLYAGYEYLDLTRIFVAGIFIGSSGAMMDLSVDITSAVHEVVTKCPDISRKEAIKSGMNVGRAAMGTMTTTLLLAYSGGYVALLMVFMAQGNPVDNILNYKYVASEILDTIVGSFGLVTVAPCTAVCAGIFLTKPEKKEPKV